jgi:pyruvate formate lyase activating enzyme
MESTPRTAHPARWWRPLGKGRVLCELCPRDCRLRPGQTGWCWVRRNEDGALVTDAWEAGLGFAVDPLEKKPLYHFLPGERVLSFGSAGCNLGCAFCQNAPLSRDPSALAAMRPATAGQIVAAACEHDCRAVAFTYNEPTIFGEFALAVAERARAAGLRTVMVTNGYIRLPAAREIYAGIDAANVDLKAFDEGFYRALTRSRLAPVLEFLVWLRRETRVWLELTHLLIPGENDDPGQTARLCAWIAAELGRETPLHLTAFHPAHRLLHRPPTPAGTLLEAARIAREAGLRHVYLGNLPLAEGRDTVCAACGSLLIERLPGRRPRLVNPRCPGCGSRLAGVFD